MDSKNNLIYLNNNRSTRMDEAVKTSMSHFTELDETAKAQELPLAEQKICRMLNCDPSELLFTKGTTESIVLALNAVFEIHKHKKPHFITTVTEHPAVLNTCKELELKGAEITYLTVDREGLIDTEELNRSIKENTVLVSVMAANNETGVIQPLEEISSICKKHRILFFSDASQYVGKMRSDVEELGIDLMAFGAHKMYGPEGIGCLYIHKDHQNILQQIKQVYTTRIDPVLIVGFGKAAELSMDNYWETSAHISKLKNYLEHYLLDIEGLRINGTTRNRLYTTSNITFPENYAVSELLSEFEFAHHLNKTSYVLQAMGLNPQEIKNSYRFSFGKHNTLEEIKLLLEKCFQSLKIS